MADEGFIRPVDPRSLRKRPLQPKETFAVRAVAVFNNKGGVGKTTLLCNLAAYLALALDYKVLIVDADPQCGASLALLPEEAAQQLYGATGAATVHDALRHTETRPIPIPAFGVDLLPGDPRLALLEDSLAEKWAQALAGKARGWRGTLVFRDLVRRMEQYDLVFFDMGSSLGPLNRAVLLAADSFITPVAADLLGLRNLESVGKALEKWRKAVPEAEWRLQFAGYVALRPSEGHPAVGKRVPAAVEKQFVSPSQPLPAADLLLGQMPSYPSLVPMSQAVHKPIFALTSADGVQGAHFLKVQEYRHIINDIANRLLSNLEALQP